MKKMKKTGLVYVNSRGTLNKKYGKIAYRLRDMHETLKVLANENLPVGDVNLYNYDNRTLAWNDLKLKTYAMKRHIMTLESTLNDIKKFTAEFDNFVSNDVAAKRPKKE